VWLVTGLLVPISLLPGFVEPIGWLLAPTWGIKAIRAAALGGDPVGPMLMTLALGVVYLVIGGRFLTYFELRARRAATLSLT
jgi:ABC-2 type transport system permease protein